MLCEFEQCCEIIFAVLLRECHQILSHPLPTVAAAGHTICMYEHASRVQRNHLLVQFQLILEGCASLCLPHDCSPTEGVDAAWRLK